MDQQPGEKKRGTAFRWVVLAVAVVFAAAILLMLNDIRLDIKSNMQTVDKHLPEIMTRVDKTSDTVAEVADDIAQLRDLAGLQRGERDKSIVVFADKVLDLVQESGGQIGLTKKIFGSGLKELKPAQQWAVAARREAVYYSFRVTSKEEMLEKLTTNIYGSEWYIQLNGEKPQKLSAWLTSKLPKISEGLDEETAAE